MPELEHELEHVAEALARLLEQHKRKPRIRSAVEAQAAEVQAVEDALWQMYTEESIENGVGVQLDRIGKIIGLGRDGLTDGQYRPQLRAWIKVRRSAGTAAQLIEIVRLSQDDPTFALTLTEPEPATVRVVLDQPVLLGGGGRIKRLFRLLKAAKSAGVKLYLEGTISPFDDVFSFGDVPTETGSSHGWGDADDPDVGGEFVAGFSG